MTAVVLIPAYNEEKTIGTTLEAVFLIADVAQVIVIDDGSADATGDIARKAGATVIRNEKNLGKGAALQLGVEKLVAESASFDIVLLLDADLGSSAREAERLLGPVMRGLADMTVGILPKVPGSGGFGVVRDLARRAIREHGGGYDAQAPLSGQRALTRECLQAVLPFAEGFGVEVAMTIRALKQNLRVFEMMVDMQHRTTGKDLPGFIHRGMQYLDVHRTIRELARE